MKSFKNFWFFNEDVTIDNISSNSSSLIPNLTMNTNTNTNISPSITSNNSLISTLTGKSEVEFKKQQEKKEKQIIKLKEKRDLVINNWNTNKGGSSNVVLVNYDEKENDKEIVGIILIITDPVLKHFEKDITEKIWKDEIFIKDLVSTFAEHGIVIKVKSDFSKSNNYYAKLTFEKDEKEEEDEKEEKEELNLINK